MGLGHNHDHGAGAGSGGSVQTATGGYRRRLMVVLGIYLAIILSEVIGAWITGSVALLAEAMHMAVDGSGILIALIATFLATRKASAKRTYGMMRAEIVAVLINCLLLFALGGYILYEAIERWFNPAEVAGSGVIAFAIVGVIGSSISLVVLSHGAKESLNVKAAFLEVMSDGIGAAAIIISGILNVTIGWTQGDAIAAAVIGVIVLPRAYLLLKQAVNIIMQGVPEGFDVDKARTAIEGTEGVRAAHSLHVWSLTNGVPVMSAHIELDQAAWSDGRGPAILDELTEHMREDFGIEHATFQFEEPGHLEHEGAMHRDLAGLTATPSFTRDEHSGHNH